MKYEILRMSEDFNIKVSQIHAVSWTQQGRQMEPSVETLRSPELNAELCLETRSEI